MNCIIFFCSINKFHSLNKTIKKSKIFHSIIIFVCENVSYDGLSFCSGDLLLLSWNTFGRSYHFSSKSSPRFIFSQSLLQILALRKQTNWSGISTINVRHWSYMPPHFCRHFSCVDLFCTKSLTNRKLFKKSNLRHWTNGSNSRQIIKGTSRRSKFVKIITLWYLIDVPPAN